MYGFWEGSADGARYHVAQSVLIDGPDSHQEYSVSIFVEKIGKSYTAVYDGVSKRIAWAGEVWTRC